MRFRRSARYLSLLFVGIFLLPLVLTSCQVIQSGQVKPAQATQSNVKPAAGTPQVKKVSLPATWTPTPAANEAQVLPTSTRTPTATATPNMFQTVSAKQTAANSIKCRKHPDAWEVRVEPGWKEGWCLLTSNSGMFYEYQLIYPAEWQVNTFGDVFPNLFFYTDKSDVELRLYEAYRYHVRSYSGTLEDAPSRAALCDPDEKCQLIVDPNEKILSKEVRAIGGRETLVLDSFDGTRNVRRYFFFVPYRLYRPKTNRLYYIQLFTPNPVGDGGYKDLEAQIETLLVSIKAEKQP